METSPAPQPEPVVLIIADISGYTRYMTANVKTFAHSQTIITELVKAIVAEVELPLEVAKLEGDAVFLFARKGRGDQSWSAQKRLVGEKLLTLFEVFRRRIGELSYSTTCNCNACTHIESLRLKLVVHSGEALFHQVFNFQELAGVDVIIVHRLLKNSLSANQYLLLTEAAQGDIDLPAAARLEPGVETYDDIGRVNVRVYYPDGALRPPPSATAIPPGGFPARFGAGWGLFLNLWFNPIRTLSAPSPQFHHLAGGSGKPAQLSFAVLTLLLTPIYLPVGTARVAWRALKAPGPAKLRPPDADHVHAPDGSCCKKGGKMAGRGETPVKNGPR